MSELEKSEIKLTRAEFLQALFGVFALMWTGLTTYPIFRYISSGAKHNQDEGSEITTLSLGKVEEFLRGASKNFKFGNIPAIILRTEDGAFFAYSAVCTHLGCTVQYSNEKKQILCACHGGQFDPLSGKNMGGPPPRPLTALLVTEQNGEIIVSKA